MPIALHRLARRVRAGAASACAALLGLAALAVHAQSPSITLFYQTPLAQALVPDSLPHVLQSPATTFTVRQLDLYGVAIESSGMNVYLEPESGGTMSVGAHENAIATGTFGSVPGITMTNSGYNCTNASGRFVVLQVTTDPYGNVTSLAVDFEVQCTAGAAPIYAELRVNSSVPLTMNKPANSVAVDPFRFVPAGPLAPNTLVYANSVTAYGINAPTNISISGGQYSVNAGPYTSAPGTVQPLDHVQVRLNSPTTPGSAGATLTMGGYSATFLATTYGTGQPLTALHLVGNTASIGSSSSTVDYVGAQLYIFAQPPVANAGVQDTFEISTPTGYLELNLSDPSGSLTVGPHENAQLFGTTQATRYPGLSLETLFSSCGSLTSGRYVILEMVRSSSGTLTSLAVDFEQSCDGGAPLYGELRFNSTVPTTPFKPSSSTDADPFAFPATVMGVPGQWTVSNPVTVRGVPGPVAVSIARGEYSVDGGAFTSASQYIAPYSHIVVRTRAPLAAGGVASTTLTMGSATPATFVVTTFVPGTRSTGVIYRRGIDAQQQYVTRAPTIVPAAYPVLNGDGMLLDIYATNGDFLQLQFQEAANRARMVPGRFEAPAPSGGTPSSAPIFSSFLGSACTNGGRFVVREVAYDNSGNLTTFAADFEALCGQLITGEVRLNSAVPFEELAPNPSHVDIGAGKKIDFTGDGDSDVLVKNADGSYSIRTMSATFETSFTTIIPANSGKTVVATGDFDGDGKTDLVVQDFWGQTDLWLNVGSPLATTTMLMPAGYGWIVSQVGDFNGDGKSDLLWTNVNDGSYGIWLMNGAAQLQRAGVMPANTVYTAVGVGDFNNDGKSDIVWRNIDGTTSVWLMNGLDNSNRGPIMAANAIWRAVKLADFDGDGKSDILWQNLQDGSVSMWLMDSRTVKDRGSIMPASTWTPTLATSWNGAHPATIVWRNLDGTVGQWHVNGRTQIDRGTIMSAASGGSAWTPVATGDFDNDGISDLLFTSADGGILEFLNAGPAHALQQQALTGGILFSGRDWAR